MNEKITIAVFDFDGTITVKDTLIEFLKFSKGRWCFYFKFLMHIPLIIGMKFKLFPNWRVKQMIFSSFFKGIPVMQFNQWCNDFSSVIEKFINPDAIDALNNHREKGDKIIIISASIENWIKPWAKINGIEYIFGTAIEVDSNNLITGKFSSKNCYGKEKVSRLLMQYPKRDQYNLTAYGDSQGDIELLSFADKAFYRRFK